MSKLLSARRATEYFLQLLGAVALAGYFSGIHLELRIFSAAVLAIVWYGLFFFVQRFGSPKSKSVAVGVLSAPRHVAAARVGRTVPKEPKGQANQELLSALMNLGYSKRDALQATIQTWAVDITFDEQIRAALALLAPKGATQCKVN